MYTANELLTKWMDVNLAPEELDAAEPEFFNADMLMFAFNYFKYRVQHSTQLNAAHKANLINYALQKSNKDNLAMLRNWLQNNLVTKNQDAEFNQKHMLAFAAAYCQQVTAEFILK